MFFGIVVGKVEYAWSPKNSKLSLLRAVDQPPKSHVHAFRFFCFTVLFMILDAVLLSVRSDVPSFG
jgi:hypothetical protein